MFLLLAASGKRARVLTASLGDDILISPAMDEADELEEGLADIDEAIRREKNPRSGPYWPKIRAKLLEESSSQDIDEAIKEWGRDGLPYISRESCQLCGKTPIKFCFPLKNRMNGSRLVVGCECVHNYLEIGGYESPEALRKLLVAQLNILRKKEKGEATDEQVEAATKVFEIEHQIRRRIAVVSGGATDFDIKEYQESLNSVILVANHLEVKDASIAAARSAMTLIKPVLSFMEKTRAKQKFVGFGIGVLTTTIMNQRSPEKKAANLEILLSAISRLFDCGLPSDTLSRAWGSVSLAKNKLVDIVAKKCDTGKAELLSDYRNEIAITKPHEHLSFMITQGIDALRKTFDAQLEKVRAAVEDPDFIEKIQSEASVVAKILNFSFSPDLASSDNVVQRNAYKIIEFVQSVNKGKGAVDVIVDAIQGTYALEGAIKDRVGVKVSILRAGDDGVIDPDVMGDDSILDFGKLIRARDPKALEIVQKEVEDVALLVKSTNNQRVFELMSDQLDFDVERAFKLYTATPNPNSKSPTFELDFCTSILSDWEAGRLSKLSPARMGNIQRQIAMKGRMKEVPNSMWEKLKSRLTAKAKSTFR